MSHTRCDDNILSKEKSPDGRFVAITYTRRCANNTGLYTCVDLAEDPGTAPVTGEVEPVLTISGIHDIKTVWKSPKNLEISTGLVDAKKIITQRDSWRTVTISHTTPPP